MNKVESKLTVFFEKPYWKGIFERTSPKGYEVIKVVFGPEPKDYDVYSFIQENYLALDFKNASQESEERTSKKIGYKKLQRKIKKELASTGMGTKAQEAVKLQHQIQKSEKKKTRKEKKQEKKERMFLLKQEKRKQKHRGH